MPPTKNLIWVAVISGLLFLLLKVFLHSQLSKSNYEALPMPPSARSRSR